MGRLLMRAGRLNQRVTIQSPAVGQDEYGSPLTGWTDFAVNIPAEVLDVSGREFLASAAINNSVTTKILIRPLAGVIASMRVLHGADVYNITAPLKQRDRTILLMCVRMANG